VFVVHLVSVVGILLLLLLVILTWFGLVSFFQCYSELELGAVCCMTICSAFVASDE
jgi:hypothetical protein